ncbi:molybdopterin-guanine dinucleotide biosynthesis protein B [Sporomusaceae bacterium BoRhaA]|uniref:molybdopterin-guanine dinucleotide biosynthesis protein B n=1 Tax=Pelorhabdus rhamnosifermentans TaxID=2772457 RepID=UPI001FE8B4DC|nr:molybdopterin-guanine dinucleotide biosynthesis protein B [Pelorhabdus rhamnosifermentans]MBU2702363.1 molybdopterin-guanine dinucleotide biosynthesis protein B [Pelorhabdus rhamnosifermentans]
MNCRLIPVISIVAKSGTGKTTLLEKVIRKLKIDGIRLAVIKHDAHQFTMDQPGKDTWRLAQAGADVVAISSPHKMAMIEKVTTEKSLDEMIAMISGVDLILTEGFKRGDKPKIEVFRSTVHQELLCRPDELLAIASDVDWQVGVPCYPLEDITGITGVIKQYMEDFTQ